jgi:hypothetical protein
MRILKYAVITVSLPFLLGSSCPTNEPPLPPTLASPEITSIAISYQHIRDSYYPAVHLQWQAPDTDSVSVNSYTVIRMADTSSTFGIIIHGIPDSITDYFDLIDKIPMPGVTHFSQILYRVIAIDSLGRPSDTSLTDTVILYNPPKLVYPLASLDIREFRWSISGYGGPYTTYMILEDSLGAYWQSTPVTSYVSDNEMEHSVTPPDTIHSGTYEWVVKADVPYPVPGTVAGSIAMGQINVP